MPASHPLPAGRCFDDATGGEPDPHHLLRPATESSVRYSGNEFTDRMISRALVRSVPNRPGVPLLAEGKDWEALGDHVLNRAHRSVGQPHA